MAKLNWVIDADILGNVCRKNVNNDAARKFLEIVKEHIVLVNSDVQKEYKPMSGRRNLECDNAGRDFIQQWYIQLVDKFGKKIIKLQKPPDCLIRQLGKKFKREDCVYVRLALSNNDKLLVAAERHFQNVKECIEGEKYNIQMFNEIEALDFLNNY